MEKYTKEELELKVAEEWWSNLSMDDKKKILNKLNVESISDYFLPMVWKLELWLTAEEVNKKINNYIVMQNVNVLIAKSI